MKLLKFLNLDEPLGLTEWTTTMSASIPKYVNNKYKLISYFFAYFFDITLWGFFLTSFINMFDSDDFFAQCLQSAHFVVSTCHLIAKRSYMRKKQDDFTKLFNEIKEMWAEFKIDHKELLNRSLSSINKSIFLLYLIFYVQILSSNIATVIFQHKLPLQIWVPPFMRSSYTAGCIWQLTLHSTALIVLSYTTAFSYSITVHTVTLGEALIQEMSKPGPWNQQRQRNTIMKHTKILKFVEQINNLMSARWALEMVCASVQLTLPGYRAVKSAYSPNSDIQDTLTFAFILCVNLLLVYLLFENGNRILTMGDKLNDAMYNVPWNDWNAKTRKDHLISLMETTRPLAYRFRWLLTFDRPKYTTALQATYSYMAMLSFFDSQDKN